MKKHEFFVFLGALLFGLLMLLGSLRGCPLPETPAEAAEVKRVLLREADLERVHHEVYQKVGEEVWEYSVKPDFLQAITWRTVYDTGKILPEQEDVLEWVRTHPEEARRLMRLYGARYERVEPPSDRP